MSVAPEAAVLVLIQDRIEKALQTSEVTTAQFVDICHVLIPLFDNLGTVFTFAKKEFADKNASLREACSKFRTLRELVEHDKRVDTSPGGSCARNLHRLGSALTFIVMLMTELTRSLSVQLKDAANTAYQYALAPIHTKLVKSVVTAGLLALPTRAQFLKSLNESEETAKARAQELSPLVQQLVSYVESLYDEPMPVSNTWFISV